MSFTDCRIAGEARGPRMTSGAKVLLVVLLCGAVTANYFRLPLYFKLDLLFGSIFTMIIVQLYGFRLGVLSAVVSGAYAWFFFNHHFSGINFVCEAAFVGYLLTRKGKGLVFLSVTYWALLGMPMAWLYFNFFRPMGTDLALLIMFKQGINGIFNALAAKMIVTLFPLSRRLAEITGKRRVTLQQIISTTLAACVLFPLLTLTILSIREEFQDEMTDLSQRELRHVAYHSLGSVQSWMNERFSDISALARLHRGTELMLGDQRLIHQTNELDKNILQIGLIDHHGISIAFDPSVDGVTGTSNIGVRYADEARLQAVKSTRKLIISDVMAGAAGQSPIVVVDAPIFRADRFAGFVTGVLNLQGLSDLLSKIAQDWSCKAVLLDKDRRIIAGSEAAGAVLQRFEMKDGSAVAVDGSTYQWVPKGKGDPGSVVRWRQSYYVTEVPVGLDTSWRLVLELPLEPRLRSLNRLFTKELFFMVVMIIPTLAVSSFIGKRLVSSLNALRDATTGLPDMVSQQKKVEWPASFITEISTLIGNFQSVTASLSDTFNEISATNQDLFRENRERRLAEEKLGRATKELTAIFQAFPDLCIVTDAETTVLDSRGGAVQDFSPWGEALRGKRLTEALPSDVAENYRSSVRQVLGTGSIATLEYCLHGESGDSYYEARLVPLSHELVVIIVRNVTDLKKAEELRVSHEQLRNLSAYLEDVRENERAHIAREIHDELGQQLTALRFDLGWINKKMVASESAVAERVGSMAQLVDRTIQTVRRIAMELRPRLLDDLGLVAAMEWQVGEFQERTGIDCQLHVACGDLVVERKRSTALFRILQEALTNIIRHAHCSRVDVSLAEGNGLLILQIADNGRGISNHQMNGNASFGIMGMHERAREWGGTVVIAGEPGHGTTIRVEIPVGDKEG